MSGILGFLALDDEPAASRDLAAMASLVDRRGPDRTGVWLDGPVGLGHSMLVTTPELAFERQPVVHGLSGCVITADVRLDNREELLVALRLPDRAATLGDAGLILEAYLAWGEGCVEKLLGDFAFAIWDSRKRAIFCARDQFGMRPFYYHHTPGRFFVFASEPRAILVLPNVPYQINEGRVADYLVSALEWIDYTSTFFEAVFRLPPAHALRVTRGGLTVRRYWTLEPGPELRLSSKEAYAEALLAVLTEAVRTRLRSPGPAASMLSGGLDSGSIVAIASGILAAQHKSPLHTFSAVGPDPATCLETRTIHASLTMEGLAPHQVDYTDLGDLMPELEDLSWNIEEPFDFSMVLLRCMYLAAQRQGIRVVLDGAAGDVVLAHGTQILRLFRRGNWLKAVREAYARDRFFGFSAAWAAPIRNARAALTPDVVRRARRRLSEAGRAASLVRDSIISPEFAQRVSLVDRLRTLGETYGTAWMSDQHREHAFAIHPNLTAGRERYDRVASAVGVEPRDPFLDRRVVAFCLTLPGSQRLDGGWPKVVLRRAMAGRLPDAVRWRRGKQHLGWKFVLALMHSRAARMKDQPDQIWEVLRPFVNQAALQEDWRAYFDDGRQDHAEGVYDALNLATWLQRAAQRPVARPEDSC